MVGNIIAPRPYGLVLHFIYERTQDIVTDLKSSSAIGAVTFQGVRQPRCADDGHGPAWIAPATPRRQRGSGVASSS